jgi:hypothetical protein
MENELWDTLKNNLLTEKYTFVNYRTDERGVPNRFRVLSQEETPKELSEIKFQSGPIKESGINGVQNEDLIAMCISRLEAFQNSEFKCRENAVAITKLEEALMWLRKRTTDREIRGVEGTHTV